MNIKSQNINKDYDLIKESKPDLNNKVKNINDKSGLLNENYQKNDFSLLSLSTDKKKSFDDENLKLNFKSGFISGKENFQL